MQTWLAIVAVMLLAGYSAWSVVTGLRDARTERPRLTYRQSLAHQRYGWAMTVTMFGFATVMLVALIILIGVTQAPALMALTGIERFTFPVAVAAFAALFFGARLLFRAYLGKRWVREVIALGSVVIGIALVFFVLSLAS